MATDPRETPAPAPEPTADDRLTLTTDDVRPLTPEDAAAIRGGEMLMGVKSERSKLL